MLSSCLTANKLDSTEDFENAVCFEARQEYRLQYHEPSNPNVKIGISLTKEGAHYDSVRERSRYNVEAVLQQGKECWCRVERRGKRWSQFDDRLKLYREWQAGEAFFWVEDKGDNY